MIKTKNASNELQAGDLRWHCCLEDIPYSSTAEASPCDDIIGQSRALKAIRTGLEIKSRGYNIFITGMVGTGRTTTIKQLLERLEKGEKSPDDLLFVNNFKYPDEPSLITLPAGEGKRFAGAMDKLILALKAEVPSLLKNPYYSERRDAIIEDQQKKQRTTIEEFEKKATEAGFSLIQVQMGLFTKPDLIPLIDGKSVPLNKLDLLANEKKITTEKAAELKASYESLSAEMESVFQKLKDIDEETRSLLDQWDRDSITPLIKDAVADVRSAFSYSEVDAYLAEVEQSLTGKIELFKSLKKEDKPVKETEDFLEYRVNIFVDNSDQKGPPVIMETNPTYVNLFGSIEYSYALGGIGMTDFTKIKAGSFIKANGGYLVINAIDALVEPGVWTTLKRSLRNQEFEIQNYLQLYLFSASRMKPESIKCDVKVVMIGDAYIYSLLFEMDEDFKKIFKIKAEFDSAMPRTMEAMADFARFTSKIINEDNLLPMDKTGMGGLVEYASRVAGKQDKLSTRFHIIADVIREASFWAGRKGRKEISREDVDKAIKERFERVSLIEDKIQEMIEDGTIMIDTQGAVIGQVNGLSVYDMGQFMFGKPTRITARTAMGRAGVINIEREADLSGRTHNKGVLILAGYLRGKYAKDKPFALSASLAFEQSYGGVDGDSATVAEVCAIVSSLSDLPVRQDLAVTGSLNQKGEVQPIGGVNEKIEGFFEVCRAKGLTGTQGVVIPVKNVKNLMLGQEVVKAVEEGKFHIYPVETIDEALELLIGVEAGRLLENGNYEEGTINYLVDAELKRLAKSWKEFAGEQEKPGDPSS